MHLILLFAAASLACPALDTATVSGALGEVQVTVTHAEKSSGYTCVFTRLDYELTLELNPIAAPDRFAHFAEIACQGGREITPVRAIGNEAIACTLGTDRRMLEKIVSRVRNQAFTLALSTTDKAADRKSIRSKNAALAEQVAGNLF